MSIKIPGSDRCMMYHVHYVGGPSDGMTANCFRPYFQLSAANGVYKAEEEPPDHLEWVDDWTRKITLHFQG